VCAAQDERFYLHAALLEQRAEQPAANASVPSAPPRHTIRMQLPIPSAGGR